MAEVNDLHVDKILSNLSIKYKNEGLLADMLLPIIKVNKRSDKFFKYVKEDNFRIISSAVGPKANPNEVDWKVEPDNYSVMDYALADYLPIENIENADIPLTPRIDTNEFLNELLAIDKEKRVADLIFAAATYPTGNKKKLSGTSQWGGSADDPIGDILGAVEGCFMRANILIFGYAAWMKFRTLPEVLDAVKASTRNQDTPGGLATTLEIAALFEVEKVLVGRAKYISTKEGQSATYARIWGKHCAALHVKSNPGIKTITFGATFSEMEKQTQTMFDAKRGAKGAEYIKVAYNADEKIIASDLGYFIEDAVS